MILQSKVFTLPFLRLLIVDVAFGPGSKSHGKVSDLEIYFTEVAVPEWKTLEGKRKPVVLILASSAIRCVDILKGFTGLRNKLTISKLFAKHFKIAEQKAFLASHPSPVAIGTPARILKLGQDADKPIDLDDITHLIIDTWQDGKDRTIFDVPEVRKELIELLRQPELLNRLNKGEAKIYFF
jgi:protein CMS1